MFLLRGQGKKLMSAADSFLDTNIFVYAVDNNYPEKQKIARKLISELTKNDKAVLSTQVLQEFYNIATKKMGISKEKARAIIDSLIPVRTIDTTRKIVVNAIEINIKYQFSIWDSLVLSAAKSGGCTRIYTDDLNSGEIVEGVEIINPFA